MLNKEQMINEAQKPHLRKAGVSGSFFTNYKL
jgi:hypothetical protein